MIVAQDNEDDFFRLVSPHRFRCLDDEVEAEVDAIRQPHIDGLAWSADGVVTAEAVYGSLDAIRVELERRLLSLAEGWSPGRWLAILRRVPLEVFQGTVTQSFLATRRLAEVGSARSSTRAAAELDPKCPLDSASAEAAIVLCRFARCLKHLHAVRRLAAKDFPFRRLGRAWLQPDWTDSQRTAVEAYDRRVDGASWPSLGVAMRLDLLADRADCLLWLVGVSEPELLEQWPGV